MHYGAFDPFKVLRAPYLFSGRNTQRYFSGRNDTFCFELHHD
jgi:hypothetical protein